MITAIGKQEIKTISLALPFKLGTVNCYLIKTDSGYVLIDTGGSNSRTGLEKELASAGCQPGSLKLIIITHGDFDHIGNAAFLRYKFGAKIAMHNDDSGMAERGDMFWNRKKGNRLIRMIAPRMFGFSQAYRFKPDWSIVDGATLIEYGFNAQVVSISGHSKGSIGILTADGNLFCGDLFENVSKPALNSIMDDLAAANASVEKLERFEIKTVHPGHGSAFVMAQLRDLEGFSRSEPSRSVAKSIQLEGVGKTLLIPLWARAKESQKANPVLSDPKAVDLLKNFDTAQIDKSFNEYYQLTWAIRAKSIDDEIKSFLRLCPNATVVNIGAGLDTTFDRIDNGTVRWYDLDLPDVIDLRKRLIPETARSTCIAKSVLDLSWFDDIGNPVNGLLFTACGVFSYFKGKVVKQLFDDLATRFPNSEVIFDAPSKFVVWSGNWVVLRKSGMGTRTPMKWGVDFSREITRWDNRIQIVEEHSIFTKIRMDASWSKGTVRSIKRADRLRAIKILHLRFRP